MMMTRLSGMQHWMIRVFGLLNCLLVSCGPPQSNHLIQQSAIHPKDEKAFLALKDIHPVPKFDETGKAVEPPKSVKPDPRAMRYLRKGRRRFEARLWAEAMDAFEKSLQFDSSLWEARVLLARSSLQLGNFGLAENNLHEVLTHRPRDVATHQLLGQIAWQQNNADEAIREFRLALLAAGADSQQPEIVLAHLTLAKALQHQGYLTAAADELRAYLHAVATPTPEMNQYLELGEIMILYRGKAAGLLGDIETQLKDYDRAIEAYRQAIKEHPKDSALRKRYVLALAGAKRGSEALDAARQWLEDFPKEASGFQILEQTCDLLGQPQRFDAELIRLAEQSDRTAMRVKLAELLLKRDKVSAAINILERTTSKSEAVTPETRYLLTRLYAKQGDFEKSYDMIIQTMGLFPSKVEQARSLLTGTAEGVDSQRYVEHARRMAKTIPDNAYARFAWGLILTHQHRPTEALIEFKAAINLNKTFGAPDVEMARLYNQQKRWADTITAANAAIAKGIRLSDLFYFKGVAHEALDEIDEAETALLDAFRMDRTSSRPLFCLAESSARRGDRRRCEQFYRRILNDVDPRFIPAREKLVRLYLNTGKIKKAREYYSDFQRLDQHGPAIDRCRAMMSLTTSTAPSGQARMKNYHADLSDILRRYPQDPITYLDFAKSFFAVNDFAKALDYVEQMLRIAPDHLAGRELKATLLTKLLQFDQASETLRSLLKDRPRNRVYLEQLLECSYNQGDYTSAIDLLQQLLRRKDLQSLRESLTNQLIIALTIAERFDEAAQIAKSWLDESPQDVKRRSRYLATLNRSKRHDEAIALARRYLDEDPTDRDLQIQLLVQLQSAKHYVQAQQLVLGWLEDSPEDIDLNSALIRLCWSAKNWSDAIDIARTGAETSEYRLQYENWLGQSYIYSRRYDEAIDFYREKADVLGTEPAYRALIAVLIEAEQFAEAERVAHRVLRPQLAARDAGQPYNKSLVMTVRNFFVEIYQDTGRDARAIHQLEEIYKLTPDDPLINNNLGYSWTEAGIHLDRAEKMVRFSLSANPRSYANLDSLGWVLYKKSQFQEAIYYLRRSLRFSRGEDPVVLDHLADALYRIKEVQEAKSLWQKAAQQCGPDHDPPPDREQRHLYAKITAKLLQMAEGTTVSVAEVVESSATTQPSTKRKD